MEPKLENNLQLLKKLPLEIKKVWEIFLAMTEIPHGSGNIEEIKKKLQEYGKSFEGLEVINDEVGNVLIRRGENPLVCLQGHMDMVCVNDPSYPFDFTKDPLLVKIEGDWLTAEQTTLGADNGIGVAMALALLTDSEVDEIPFEMLFTVDEETTMIGAKEVGCPYIKSKYLVNIDSEENGHVCVGSAGGGERVFQLPIERAPLNPEEWKRVDLYLHGLKGGHSGVDIHLGHSSAILWMERLLRCDSEIRIGNFSGGNAKNAIPNVARASVAVKDPNKFMDDVFELHGDIMKEYRAIETRGVTLEAEVVTEKLEYLTIESSLKVLDLVASIPHGVIRMHPDIKGLVETSQNLAIISLTDKFEVQVFMRSSSLSQMRYADHLMRAVCDRSGTDFIFDIKEDFPSWEPQMHDNPLLEIVKKSFLEIQGKEPIVESIHAGLEVSLIQTKYPTMLGVSIGPTIQNPHSADERLEISTVSPNYNVLKKILLLLKEKEEEI